MSQNYRPNPDALATEDELDVPTMDEVLDWCENFEEAHSEDGSPDAFRQHFDPHWGLYSLVACLKYIDELETGILKIAEAIRKGEIDGVR